MNILESILDTVYTVSNKEYQIRVWIKGMGPECYSYDEAVNDFFQICDTPLDESKQFNLTEPQYKSLKIFKDAFWKFHRSPLESSIEAEFIDTPEWAEVMQKAQNVIEAFNYIRKPFER